MKPVKLLGGALTVALGVFIAGYAMNALRDINFVDDAIKGFDT